MSVVEELGRVSAQVREQVEASVVTIGRSGRGSGIVVADGRVLTNAHNLRDRTTSVAFADGRREQAGLLAADLDGDLAVLDVDTGEARPLQWRDGAEPQPGEVVFAAAAGRGQGVRLTFGSVTAVAQAFRGPRGRPVRNAFEHAAPLPRGASGGPVVDVRARLVGVNTSRAGDGFYLALPATASLRERVDALARGERPQRVQLGVGLAPPEVADRLRVAVGLAPRGGVLVRHVADGSAAKRAGLQAGDLLVAAAGRELRHVDDLLAVLDELDAPGDVTLRVVRGADEREVVARFDEPEG